MESKRKQCYIYKTDFNINEIGKIMCGRTDFIIYFSLSCSTESYKNLEPTFAPPAYV